MKRGGRRDWLLFGALGLLPLTAYCETYAVVPLVGRQLTLVTAQRTTATNVDRNQYQYLPIGDAVFDDTVNATVARSGTALSALRAPDGNPLNALIPAEKAGRLQTLLAKSVTDILPALLQRVGPANP